MLICYIKILSAFYWCEWRKNDVVNDVIGCQQLTKHKEKEYTATGFRSLIFSHKTLKIDKT